MCSTSLFARSVRLSTPSRVQPLLSFAHLVQPSRGSCQQRYICQAAGDEDAEQFVLRQAACSQAALESNATAATAGASRRSSWPPMVQQLLDAVLGNRLRALVCLAIAAVGMLVGTRSTAFRQQHISAAGAHPQTSAVAGGNPRHQASQHRSHRGSYSWQDRALLLDASRAAHARPPGSPVWISAAQPPGASELLPRPATQFASMSSPVGISECARQPYSKTAAAATHRVELLA
jgi:type IV secretory pathway VirB2 component (pilin)